MLDRERLQGPGNSSCGFTHSQGHLEVKLHSHLAFLLFFPLALRHTDRTDLVYRMLQQHCHSGLYLTRVRGDREGDWIWVWVWQGPSLPYQGRKKVNPPGKLLAV